MSLNHKQQRFVSEYMIDQNGTQAAIRAGYSEKTAGSIANENLKKPEIRAEIEARLKKVEEKSLVSVEYVINGFKTVAERCLQAEQVMEFDHENKEMVPTGEWKFDSSGANKALENLGRYLKLFTDKIQIENFDELAERLEASRKRSGK